MIEMKKNTTAGEPVKEQAPASTEAKTDTTTGEPVANQAPANKAADTKEATNTATPEASTTSTPAPIRKMLPPGYLSNGSMLDGAGILIPQYLSEYAEEIAKALKPMSASSFQRAFLGKAKEVNKKKVLYSTKKNCAQGMVVQAMKQVNRKKDPAPRVLLDMIRAATATVVDDATFEALYMHLDAVYTYLLTE